MRFALFCFLVLAPALAPAGVVGVDEKPIITVFYEGAFRCTGSLALKEGVTVVEAIKLNGGLNPRAVIPAELVVRLTRPNPGGSPSVRYLNLGKRAESPDNIQLEDGDILNLEAPVSKIGKR
jgi:protein involved in polysaccharide export with SLBB domain